MAQAKAKTTPAKKPVRKAAAAAKKPAAAKAPGSAIEAELLNALGIKGQGKAEERQEYLGRIGKAVAEDLSEEDYSELSDEARAWYEAAGKAAARKRALPDFPDAEQEEEGEEEQPTKPAKKAAPVQKRNGSPRGEGLKPRLFEFFTGGGKGSIEQLEKKMGAGLSSLRTALSDLRSEKYCYQKPLNIVRGEDGVYSLSGGRKRA